jgi:HAE1 family hydrophobic/amphiphilic exporter-1
MTLPELSIKRYAMAYMLNLVIVLVGVIGLTRIGIDRWPNVDFPIISVTTTLKGANPTVIDSSVSKIIEGAVNSVTGIDYIEASSTPSVSNVVIFFKSSKDMEVAFNEVQSKVNTVLNQLPSEADIPIVRKIEFGAFPIMWVVLSGDRTQEQLGDYALNVVKKQLEGIEGVGNIQLGGSNERTIRVNVDLERMAALGVTAQDLTRAFNNEHLQAPGGFMVGENREFLIKLDQEYHSLRELNELVIGYRNDAPILLKDVATIVDGVADRRSSGFFIGQKTAGLGIVKVSNANMVAVIDRVQKVVKEQVEPLLPPGMKVTIATDDSLFVRGLISSLNEHIFYGTLLAALVVLVFLHDWRSTLIVSLAIPVSLFGAVAVMYFFDFTFNSFTMLALLLLIGVVVDDAIVVLENIHRHRSTLDKNPITSAISGSNEVFFAVLAASLSLVCIFGPVIFMSGLVGKFFQSFAVVTTIGVLASFFVSLTLTPVLCSRFLKAEHKLGPIARFNEGWIQKSERGYERLLDFSLNHRWMVLGIATLVVASSGYFFKNIGKGFNPEVDESRFMVFFKAPIGSSVSFTESKLAEIWRVLDSHPEVMNHFSGVGLMTGMQGSEGMAMVRLVPKNERKLSQLEVQNLVQKDLAAIAGIRAFVVPPNPMPGGRSDPIQIVLRANNYADLVREGTSLYERLQQKPELGNVDMDLQNDLPEMNLEVDRLRATSLGLSARDVATSINLMLGGADIAFYNDSAGTGERYDIRIKANESEIGQPLDLKKLYLRTSSGQLVRADTVAEFVPNLGPAKLSKFNLKYAATYYITPKVPLAQALEMIKVETDALPLGFSTDVKGQARSFGEAISAVGFALVLALVLLYMVLASQFNGFIQPLIVMLAQPLAIVGGLFALWLFDSELVMYSMIGMVLLIGLVAKNSILLVDLTNQYRENRGMGVDEALRMACPIRMRPVVMTSLTLILAMLPAAVSRGVGAETNVPLALTVIGGMISSTLLTLVVVPAMYSLVENFRLRFRDQRMQRAYAAVPKKQELDAGH